MHIRSPSLSLVLTLLSIPFLNAQIPISQIGDGQIQAASAVIHSVSIPPRTETETQTETAKFEAASPVPLAASAVLPPPSVNSSIPNAVPLLTASGGASIPSKSNSTKPMSPTLTAPSTSPTEAPTGIEEGPEETVVATSVSPTASPAAPLATSGAVDRTVRLLGPWEGVAIAGLVGLMVRCW